MADVTNKKSALGVIFLTVFIDLVGFGMVIPLLPYLAREYGASAVQVGFLLTVYSGAQFLFSPFWGRLSDRIGRRPVILVSLFGGALSYLLFAFGSSLWVLFVARTFAGIFGANISTAMAYIADVTDEKNRSKGMGLVGAAFGLGFVFGPFMGALLGDLGKSLGDAPPFGINFSALVASGICFANFLLALKVLKESHTQRDQTKLKPKISRFKLVMQHLQKPLVGRLMFVYFLSGFAMAQMEAVLFLFVHDKFAWDLRMAGFGFAYVGLMMVFTQGFLIRRFMPKWGEKLTLVMGLGLFTVGMMGIGFIETVFALGVTMTILALGNGLSNPAILGSISLVSDKNEQGVTMGVTHSLSALGRILGPGLGGYFYDKVGMTSPFFIAGLLIFTGLYLTIVIFAKLPNVAKTKTA